MDYTLTPHSTHPNFITTFSGDVASFAAGFHIADPSSAILSSVQSVLLSLPAGMAPSQGVVDDLVRMGAALVVSVISRLIVKFFEPKNKTDNGNENKKNKKSSPKEGNQKENEPKESKPENN